MPDPEPKPKLRVREAAARHGVTPRYLYHCINERRFRFYKVGKLVLIDPNDLDAFFEDHKVEAIQ